jgi:hypothetical protein
MVWARGAREAASAPRCWLSRPVKLARSRPARAISTFPMADDLRHPDDRPDPAARLRRHSPVIRGSAIVFGAALSRLHRRRGGDLLHAMQCRVVLAVQVRAKRPAQRPSRSDRCCPLDTARDRCLWHVGGTPPMSTMAHTPEELQPRWLVAVRDGRSSGYPCQHA